MRWRYWLIFLAVCSHIPVTSASLAISDVRPDRVQIDPQEREVVTFSFRVSDPASVVLHLYDGRGIEVRHVDSTGELGSGLHQLGWDGKDWQGIQVPPEAYAYTLSATARDGTRTVFDLTDLTGGEALTPRDVKYTAGSHSIDYVLDRPARVNIRLGLQNDGPLLRTLIDWVPRREGQQSEAWDGMDGSGAISLAAHPSLAIGVNAFALPDNTIFVGSAPSVVRLIDQLPEPVLRREAAAQPKHMYDHAQQPLDSRGDYTIRLKLPPGLATRAGIPVVEGPVPLTIESDDRDRARVISRRFEPVYYVDGQFLFENEVGFLPMTWVWDPATSSEGVHYLTVNLRGYEGNFGMATRRIYVRHSTSKK
jgi:hypothetical protein